MEHGDKDEEQQHVSNPERCHSLSSNTGDKQHDDHNPNPEADQKVVQEYQHSLPESLLFLILVRCPGCHISRGCTQSHLQRGNHISQGRALTLLPALLRQLTQRDPEHESEDGLHQQVTTWQAWVFDESDLD